MVPVNASGGCSIRAGFGGAGGVVTASTAAVTGGGGGRRDAEKIGRSRVFDKVASGIAHSGFSLRVCSDATGGGSGGRTSTTVAGVAGSSQIAETDGLSGRRAASVSIANVSLGRANV